MLMGIFATLLQFLSGGFLDKILGHMEAKANTETERERIRTAAAIEAIKAEVARRNAQRDVLVAEQGNWLTRSIRPFFALPFGLYVWKLIVWDKILGWGSTDNLSPELWSLMTTVFGALFIGVSAERAVSIFKSRSK